MPAKIIDTQTKRTCYPIKLLQNATEQEAKVTVNNLEQEKKDKEERLDEHRKEVESLSTKVQIELMEGIFF